MKLEINAFSIIQSILIGVLFGYIGGPVFVLLPWAIIGLLLGIFSKTRQSALVNGAAYGFAVAYVFMLAGYQGMAPLVTKLAPFIILGLIGAGCGLILAFIGYLGRHYKR